MNPRVILYLVRTDWRRLWPAVVFLWLAVASAASPYWISDFPGLSVMAGEIRSIPDLVWGMAWRNPVFEALTRFLSEFLVPGTVVVCGLIGICGGSWTGVRPVRRREWIGAKVMETLVFVMLPLVAAVGVNLAVHGFSPWRTMGSSAMNLAPLLGGIVLTGVLCGTFQRWALWLAGLFGFAVLCALLMQGRWFHLNKIDVWGSKEILGLRDAMVFAGLGVLVVFARRFRGFSVAALAWPFIVGAMVAAPWLYQPGASYAEVGSNKELDEVKVPDELANVYGNWYDGGGNSPNPMIQWWAQMVEPQRIGTGVVQWSPVNEIGLKKDGADLPVKPLSMERRLWNSSTRLFDWDVYMGRDQEDAALRAALPAEAGNLVSRVDQGAVPVFFAGITTPKFPKESVMNGPVDFTTRLNGFLFRYEKVAELAMGQTVSRKDADGYLRVAASFADGGRVDVARMFAGDDAGPGQVAVVLMMPDKGITFRIDPEVRNVVTNHTGTEVMAGLYFSTRRFQMTRMEHERISRLFGSESLMKARVCVYERKLLARTSRTLDVPGVMVRDAMRPQDFLKWPEPVDGDLAGFFRTYLHARPDPETCTEEEAGRWIYQLLSLANVETSWRGREMVPFARSHPSLMLRMPADVWEREPVEDAIAGGFPAERKSDYLRAMTEQRGDRAFSAMFRAAVRRGWDDEAKQIARERILSADPLSEQLVEVAVSCGDEVLYPKILERVRAGVKWEVFRRIRELPEIGPDLDAAVADYEKVRSRYQRGQIRPLMIPASRGSERAFRDILDVVTHKARTGETFNGWNDVLEVVRIPIEPREWNAGSVDFKFGHLAPGDFEWNAYLQQWLPKESFRFPEP